MNGKIVLYDRENYKQARENLLLYNFYDVLESENFLDFRRFFLGADFPFLNYNHGKTKSATLEKRNVIFWCKNEMQQNTEKATRKSGFYHVQTAFEQHSKEQYI